MGSLPTPLTHLLYWFNLLIHYGQLAPSTETLQCITGTGLLIDYGQLAHSTDHDTLIIVIC